MNTLVYQYLLINLPLIQDNDQTKFKFKPITPLNQTLNPTPLFKKIHMSLRTQLKSIHTQIEQNKAAFKKNKQNISSIQNQPTFLKSNADLKEIKNVVKNNLKSLITTKQSSTQAYQCVVKQLKLLLKQAWIKNQFLVRDRAEVLKENLLLRENVQILSSQVQQGRKKISELKLHGYSGNQVNGTFQNGNIFNIVHQNQGSSRIVKEQQGSSRIVKEKQHYLIQSSQTEQNNNSQSYKVKNNISHNERSQSQQQMEQQEKSLLLRQPSHEEILASLPNNHIYNIMSPVQDSPMTSQINETPNYNFKEANFDIQNIRKVPGHFLDLGSQFVSYANSSHGSNCVKESNNKVDISMNNMNGQLYLPINQNKVVLKQEIETFKQHLRNIAGNGQENSNQSNSLIQKSPQEHYSPDNILFSARTIAPVQLLTSCSSSCQQGIFRSFYLSLMKFPFYRQKIYHLAQQLQHDQSFILYKLYPKNQFWTEMISAFLQYIDSTKPQGQEILNHLNTHPLVDHLFIQTLRSRVEYLYNNSSVNEQLDESSLLNGSVNNQRKYTHNNFESINVSLQNVNNSQQAQPTIIQQQLPSPSQTHLQVFNALANSFDLNCRPSGKCFNFYDPQHIQLSRQSQQGDKPIFSIVHIEQSNTFMFAFSLHWQKSSSTNTKSKDFANQSQQKYEHSQQQMYEYENSVKKQFQDISINHNMSSQQESNTSSQLNSHEKGSFISQTNQYQEQVHDEQQQQEESASYYGQPIISENISYRYNDTTESSLKTSNNYQQIKKNYINPSTTQQNSRKLEQRDNSKRLELRQRTTNYHNVSNNCPIQEELIKTESKPFFNTMANSKILSKKPSKLQSSYPQPNINRATLEKHIKDNQKSPYYNRQEIFDENFILRKVNSVDSDDDLVINEEDYETQPSTFHSRFR